MWYTKLLKRLLNTLAHNAFVLHRKRQNVNTINHLAFRLQVKNELFGAHRKALEPPHPGRPPKTPTPDSKIFNRKGISIWKKAKTMQGLAVCCQTSGKRKEMSFWCKDCGVALCF
jgi:hypothetical protein